MGLKATVLDVQTNNGFKAIEHLEKYADDTEFAIALFTHDDVTAIKDEVGRKLNTGSHQSVILELGYFIGKLDPHRVCLLYKEGVELPQNLPKVVYVSMDSDNDWKLKLGQEMQNAGLPIDMNKIL